MKTKLKRVAEGEVRDPAFPVAMLRIALALKLHPDAGLDEIVEQTVKSMKLSRSAFRAYLAHHMAMLAQAATDAPTKTRAKDAPVLVSTPARRPRIKMRSPR